MSKRVLHVSNIYFTLPYFIGKQFLYFKSKGYEMHAICSKSEYLEGFAEEMKFLYKEIPITRKISPFRDIISIYKIYKYLRENDIDIVVGHTPKGALLSMIAAFMARVNIRIYFRHGLVFETSTGIKRKILVGIEKLTSFFSNKIVCVSPSVYQKSLEYRLNKENKQLVLGKGTCTGIDVENKFNPQFIDSKQKDNLRIKYGIKESDFIISYCGRLVKDKGIVELMDAFLELNRKNSNYKLLLVGMFEERDALPDRVKQEIITNRSIIYTGFINEDIQYYYSLMNLFVFPSYREGFGMVVLEASAMNVPVIVSKSTGCVDSIKEGVTGEYTEINKGDIIETVEFVIANQKQKKYGINGREFVINNFKDIDVWQEIEKMY